MSIAEELAHIALEIGAIKLQPAKPFTWASGYRMPIYNDNRMLLGSYEHRDLVCRGLMELVGGLESKPEIVAGTATAGIPHAAILATAMRVPMIYVRDKAKGHGLQNQIEGILKPGQTVLMIEDLVSTGGSSVRAVEAVRAAGGEIEHCFSIFSYGLKKADEVFAEGRCKITSLLTYDVLLEIARDRRIIDDQELALLAQWRQDPFGWGASNGFEPVQKK